MDESPDVSFYVFAEPALSAPEPEDWNIWREAAHLRSENLRWRECVAGIVNDLDQCGTSADAAREAVNERVAALGAEIAKLYRSRALAAHSG